MMKKPTHFFNLESKPNKLGEHLIFFNLSYGYKTYNYKLNKFNYVPLRISTKWNLKKEYWNDQPIYRANQTYVKRFGRDLNVLLDKIEKASYDQLSYFRNTFDRDPSTKELKQLIEEKLNRTSKASIHIGIVEYTEKLIAKRTSLSNNELGHWDTSTGNQYQAVANRLKRYDTYNNSTLTFGDITEEQYWDYFKTINNFHMEDNGNYYTQTTMNKEFRSIRAIFNCAKEENIKINIDYSKKSLKIATNKSTYETYLNEEQLSVIINTDTSHSQEFTHAKNYIILSSFTGLRIGDMTHLYELKPEIIVHDSKKYHCFTTKIRKSNENVEELITTIPILKPVKMILELNNNQFPKFTSQPNIRKVIKKFLKHLKFDNETITKTKYYLVDEPKIEKKKQHELFGPHDCRRTFITNLKQLGIQNDAIEPITHPKIKNVSVLDGYDKSTLNDRAVKLIKQVNSKKSKLFKY
ncbi:MAG TPA: hypothetical protein PLL09_00275 [Flavobacterium sp.]|uniref:phage integrase SAM-like domain-containing protein n=1 Tax=unclassified Flavobacterium TaxID=196869 RepID=UPI0025C2A951|nr:MULTISPECIES: phage integrase SAM-like domain-containing protein [unclassified Flavobacterium]HRE76235.1 hypothetical protein [Flavobacterium sp.]